MPPKHHIPTQSMCPYCGSKIVRRTGDQVYEHGDPFMYLLVCMDERCNAQTTCTKDYEPHGTLARPPLRRLRQRVHQLIDPLWKNEIYSRSGIYHLLADYLRINHDECHIGLFDVEKCNRTIDFYYKLRKYPITYASKPNFR